MQQVILQSKYCNKLIQRMSNLQMQLIILSSKYCNKLIQRMRNLQMQHFNKIFLRELLTHYSFQMSTLTMSKIYWVKISQNQSEHNRLLLVESLYFFNSFTANANEGQIKQCFQLNFLSYLVSLYANFCQSMTENSDIFYIIDYLDCIFYNLVLLKVEFQAQDKKQMVDCIEKIVLLNKFQKFSLQAQECLLNLYFKLSLCFDITNSLIICSYILQNTSKKELIIIVVNLIIRIFYQSARENRKALELYINQIKHLNITEKLVQLSDEYPNEIIKYFKVMSNQQKSITIEIISLQQASLIYQKWRYFDRELFYYFLANIIPTYKIILTGILQNQQLLDEIMITLQTKQNQESKEAFYLLCTIVKENSSIQSNNQFIGILNQYFVNSHSIDEYKFYLNLILQDPTVLNQNCPNAVKTKLESLIKLPELETQVQRILNDDLQFIFE
ncbi:unnamed protein product (macronuclear) [Paramecium tetraurelia]|uniref:Uncharacterized protein n=1 Tax=Paramecium tetraurelia TaxID=5888 RepID=A0DAG3_PARTE|nr:uncharacterized protein GSPATT00014937001 [Paramecium tetraurelia]CAK80030.1 unnamed protein product [Paramecium tetraurelia]|eukprot:XP_001447427.1 hypothetical protein (macronuclear) [Paramecium tetraurelia strain d4-2]